MKWIEANDTRLAQLFVPIEGPRCLQLFPEVLLELLQTGSGEKILAVESIFEPEEIKDRGEKLTPVRVRELGDQRHFCPELILSNNLPHVQVLDSQQAALFEIREHDSPASSQIGDRSIEEVCLKRLLIVSEHGRKRGLLIPVAVV